MEIEEHDSDVGYRTGVYLCLGQPIHCVKPEQAIPIKNFKTYNDIHQYMSQHNKP